MSMTSDDARTFADNLWNNYLEAKVREMLKPYMSMKRATVKTAANGSTMGVQFPFDSSTLNIPYVTSVAGASEGDQVWVAAPYSDMSNAIVIGTATLSNL